MVIMGSTVKKSAFEFFSPKMNVKTMYVMGSELFFSKLVSLKL